MNTPLPPESAEVPRTVVVAGVLVRDGKILVVENVKNGTRLEPPGGKWEEDRGESLEEAVVRELAEEVQIRVATRGFIGAYDTDSAEAEIVVHTFLCELLTGEPAIAPSERKKLARCFWATPDELEAMPELTLSLRSALPAIRAVIARKD